jgi:hypothetical protein
LSTIIEEEEDYYYFTTSAFTIERHQTNTQKSKKEYFFEGEKGEKSTSEREKKGLPPKKNAHSHPPLLFHCGDFCLFFVFFRPEDASRVQGFGFTAANKFICFLFL